MVNVQSMVVLHRTFNLQRQSLQSVDAASCSHSVHACTMLALIFARQNRFHEFHDKEFVFLQMIHVSAISFVYYNLHNFTSICEC